ncbi:MAG TPA: hypothetical protein V6C96_01980, partial [Vampirovibrionales bacterium]
MTDTLFYPLIIIGSLLVGLFIGHLLTKLKLGSKAAITEEKNNQLKLQIEELKNNYTSNLENLKSSNLDTKEELNRQLSKIESERDLIRKEKDFLSTELATRNTEFENLAQKNSEQKKEVEQVQERFSKEFENLANKIFDQKSEKFTLLNKENIQNILDPLGEKIKSFEQKVEKNNTDFIERHAQLGEQLLHLNKQ